MPFVTLLTNLKSSAITVESMSKYVAMAFSKLISFFPRLVKFIAPLLNKPEERFNWILETDKQMSKVNIVDR